MKVILHKVLISRTRIYYCGIHSFISTVANSQVTHITETFLDQHKGIYKTGTLIWDVNNIINWLKTNYTISRQMIFCTILRTMIFAESVTTDGQCSGAQYLDSRGTW